MNPKWCSSISEECYNCLDIADSEIPPSFVEESVEVGEAFLFLWASKLELSLEFMMKSPQAFY